MKKTISKTIPSYHWVVEDLCPQCEAMAPTAPAITSADIPPLPAGAPAPRPLGKSYSVKSQ